MEPPPVADWGDLHSAVMSAGRSTPSRIHARVPAQPGRLPRCSANYGASVERRGPRSISTPRRQAAIGRHEPSAPMLPALAMAAATAAAAVSAGSPPPNVLLLFADDLGA